MQDLGDIRANAPDPQRSLAELGLLSSDDVDAAGDLGAAVSRAATMPLRRLGVGDLYTLLRLNLALPVIVPIRLEPTTATFRLPPVARPTRRMARSMNNLPPPMAANTTPKAMK